SYAFYALNSVAPSGAQHGLLYSVPAPDGLGGPTTAAVTPLIDHSIPDITWIDEVGLTGDGRRVLALITPHQHSAIPGDSFRAPGLYALRPDGTDWQLLAPGATEFWV